MNMLVDMKRPLVFPLQFSIKLVKLNTVHF